MRACDLREYRFAGRLPACSFLTHFYAVNWCRMSSTQAGEQAWQAVAETIGRRLATLGWRQADLVRVSGISATTVRDLQMARRRSYDTATLVRVAQALGWRPDGVGQVLAGRRPTVVTRPSRAGAGDNQRLEQLADDLERIETSIADVARKVDRLIDLMEE